MALIASDPAVIGTYKTLLGKNLSNGIEPYQPNEKDYFD